MAMSPIPHHNHYIMHDQVSGKIRSIMNEALGNRPRGTSLSGSEEPPMLSRPGWVAITLLVIAFNLMAVLPPAA